MRTALGARCSVTLHDLPQPGDGASLHPRRVAVYRAVIDAVDAVVVSSEHEAALVRDLGGAPRPLAVIPLPVDTLPGPVTPTAGDGHVSVLGFVHPGKGHDDALAAMAGLPSGVGLSVLGRAATGHDDLLVTLAAAARTQGRPLHVSGFVPDADLPRRLRRAGVPLAPHRAVSASGSVMTWLGAGRRPLVPDGRYSRELADRCPGAVWPYEPGGLAAALRTAIAHPERTWLGPDTRVGPTSVQAAARYVRFLGGVSP